MKNKTINVLIELGMPADIKGFQYIVDAMCLFEEETWRRGNVTGLYEKIGSLNDTTASRVERAIRHAFRMVLKNGGQDSVSRYLTRQHPTNSNLLHTLYLRLTQEV